MNKKQIACYLELFKVIKRSEMLDDKQKKELDIFLSNLKGKYDKHRKKNKRLIDYVERLREENKELHNKIDKYKSLEQSLTFIKNRVKQGMTQENINKCAIQLVNNYLKDSDVK